MSAPRTLSKQVKAAAVAQEIASPKGFYTTAATVSPDGTRLLLGTHGEIAVIDLASGTTRRIRVPVADRETVSKIRFTPDGRRVVLTAWDGSVAVLAWPALRAVAVHAVSTDRLHGCAVMPDGRSAWVGGQDCRRVRIDLETGRVLATQRGEWGWVSDVAVSPDGKTLVTGDAAGVVRLCNGTTGVERKKLRLGIAHNMIVTPSAVIVPSLELALVNPATGRAKKLMGIHRTGAIAAVPAGDGSVIASVGRDASMGLWDRASARPLVTMRPLKRGGFVSIVVAGDHLVTVPGPGQPIQLWRTQVLVDAARQGFSAKN